jgi:Predicted metal-dependent enzyme of the double-stranded beta helix superfamily
MNIDDLRVALDNHLCLGKERPLVELVSKVEQILVPFVADCRWLPPAYFKPIVKEGFSQYHLCSSRFEKWHAVLCVWPAGAETAIHDHGGWGVVGIIKGEETTVWYRSKAVSITDSRGIDEIGRTVSRKGDFHHFLSRDYIHRVINSGTSTAISLHVYEVNLGLVGRNQFDPEDGVWCHCTVPYDNNVGSEFANQATRGKKVSFKAVLPLIWYRRKIYPFPNSLNTTLYGR